MKPSSVSRLVVAMMALQAACTDASVATSADAGGSPTCRIGSLGEDGTFNAWQDGGHAELVVGFQGFMLLIARVRAQSGQLPAKPKVRMTIDREGGEPSLTTLAHCGIHQDASGQDITETLEMWLYPPDPAVFEGKTGHVKVELFGREAECTAEVDVKFADAELCKHTEDGKVFCADGSSKKH